MSILSQDSKFPEHTLRGHKTAVTTVAFVKVPIYSKTKTITLQDDQNKLTLKPFLLSADDSGKLILWDLSILRPLKTVEAHAAQVLSIRQLGIKDNLIDSNFFGLVLTHGRDHTIKFWKIPDNDGVITLDFVYELPVNSLNFSNVDVFGNLLITPNTLNSNAFDIYDITFLSQEESLDDTHLKRLFEGVDVYKKAVDTGFSKFEEFNVKREELPEDDANRVDKFGIIMKLLFVRKDLVIIGYESGHVATLKIDYKRESIEILNINNQHFPNPVLSLTFDKVNNVALSTSIDSAVSVMSINSNKNSLLELEKFGKVSGIAVLNDKYIVSSWNGSIRFYKLDALKQNLEYLSTFKKPKGLLAGDLNIIGNINNDTDIHSDKKHITKPNALAICEKKEVDSLVRKGLNRRDVKVIENSYLAVGYEDGTVTLYNDL